MVHTVSARGYLASLKRHGRGEFWTADAVELSGIPAWRDHIKELTVPARRRRCQAFLRAVLRCFNNMAIWCDNGSGINLTPEQEKQELTIYKRDLDLCVKVFYPSSQPSSFCLFPQTQSLLLTGLSAWASISILSSVIVVTCLTGFSQNG